MAIGPDFVPWLKSEVDSWADKYGCLPQRAFPAWSLHFLFEVEDDDAFNQTDTLTQGDAGIDGWHFDRESNVFHLVQAKYLENPEAKVSSGQLDALIRGALLLRNPQKIEEGVHCAKLSDIASKLNEILLDDIAISLDFIVFGGISEQVRNELSEAVTQLGKNFSASFYDISSFFATKQAEEPIGDLHGETVQFHLSGRNQFFQSPEIKVDGIESAAVAAIDGKSLASAVKEYGPKLFNGNVRYYLHRQNRVNKEMLSTLDDETGRNAFWLYNNGITIVADQFSFGNKDDCSTLLAINPQIVNGAQTSSVLKERYSKLEPGDVSVQCRIIAVTSDQKGKEALQKISEYTNSQSPVRPGDLRSNDKRHRDLQLSFGMLPDPVFYERRRGEWRSLTTAQRTKYAGRRVSKEDIGQRFLAFSGKPAQSISNKEEIFGGDLEAEAFDITVSAHVYMLANTLYLQASDLMKLSSVERITALVPGLGTLVDPNNEESMTQLEALRRGNKLVCAHAVALSREVLRWRYKEIGEQRARQLRLQLEDADSDTAKFIWRMVFRAIRQWVSAQPDAGSLKSRLQRADTFAQIRANLLDILTEVDKSALPALSGE